MGLDGEDLDNRRFEKLILVAKMSDFGSTSPAFGQERPDLRSLRPDCGSERLALGFKGFILELRLDLGSERPNLGFKRSNLG